MDAPPAPQFDFWLPALDAGVLRLADLVAWADSQILRLPSPPRWLIELSLATDDEGLWRAAAAGQSGAAHAAGPLYLGFLYLAHEVGHLPLTDVLLRAGQYADDAGQGRVPECETFYLLLNEIDGRGPTLPGPGPLPDRVHELFRPWADEARAATAHLLRSGLSLHTRR